MSGARRVATLLLVFAMATAQAAHEIPINAQQMERLGINVVQVERTTSLVSERLPARVVIPPRQERVVSVPIGGVVTELRAGIGDEIEAGEALALIESPSVIELQREYLQATTERKLTATQLKRDQRLFDEGIIAERRYLETRSAYERAVAVLEEREQALKLSGMDAAAVETLARTRKLSSALTVRASSAGVVLDSLAVVGQRIEPSEPLFRLSQLEPLWLEIRVPLRRITGIQPNAKVEVSCPGAEATVNLIGRSVDPASQTVLVRAEVRGASECLRPGQYIEARLQLQEGGELYRIPASAVVRAGDRTVVFRRVPSGFLATQIEVVGDEGGSVVIRGNLKDDAVLAVSGLAAIKGAWMGLGGGAE